MCKGRQRAQVRSRKRWDFGLLTLTRVPEPRSASPAESRCPIQISNSKSIQIAWPVASPEACVWLFPALVCGLPTSKRAVSPGPPVHQFQDHFSARDDPALSKQPAVRVVPHGHVSLAGHTVSRGWNVLPGSTDRFLPNFFQPILRQSAGVRVKEGDWPG